jgi:17beta-estradiol 17-dehydrogenase / very-long-chain 3-oxoacyl-CoA reductase
MLKHLQSALSFLPEDVTSSLIGFAALLGLWMLAKCALSTLSSLLASGTGALRKKYGEWAIVTGATDGIGQAYAMEMARKGLNVVVVSRTQSKLDATKKLIEDKYPSIQVKTVQADFSEAGNDLYDRIGDAIDGLDVGVLVNNVGVSYPGALFAEELEEWAPGVTDRLLRVNVDAVTKMTALVLPGMKSRRRGAIVCVSSANGVVPSGSPLYTLYAAGKAYVDMYARSLASEAAGFGIDVQSHIPYFVVSKMSKIRRPTFFTPTPAGYAKAAVACIGNGQASVVPFLPHRIQHLALMLPEWVVKRMLMSMHMGLRKRYLKKMRAKEAEGKGN